MFECFNRIIELELMKMHQQQRFIGMGDGDKDWKEHIPNDSENNHFSKPQI